MPKWLQMLVAATCVTVLVGVAASAMPVVPKLNPEPLSYASPRPLDEMAPASLHVLNASAVHEKQGEPGECEYPGTYAPCWCVGGTINTRGGCESAEEYLENVQMFGPPRFFVPLPP